MTRCPPRSRRRATGSRPSSVAVALRGCIDQPRSALHAPHCACMCMQRSRAARPLCKCCSTLVQRSGAGAMARTAGLQCHVPSGVYSVQNDIPSGALQARRKAHCGPSSSVAQAAACATGWSAAAPADRPEPCSAAAPGRRWCSGYNSRLAHLTSRTRDRASPSDKAQRVRLSRAPHARANR